MDIGLVVKIALVGLLIAVINQILTRLGRDEYAMLTTVAGVVAILLMLIPYINQLFDTVKGLFEL